MRFRRNARLNGGYQTRTVRGETRLGNTKEKIHNSNSLTI